MRRVETPSALGPWSYEVIDTKLARETKGNTVLQLSLYSDLLMYDGQLAACAAVRPALPAINAAVEDAVLNLKRGGRLVYVGAGTSRSDCYSGRRRAWSNIRLAKRPYRFPNGWRAASGTGER